jgi:hypothetical protein
MNFPLVDFPFDNDEMSREYEIDFSTYLYYGPTVDSQSYKNLEKLIQNFVGEDCWGLTIDDEVLFNNYQKKSIRNIVLDNVVRERIIDNPHVNLLVHIFRGNRDARIRIYMFGGQPWTVNIDFKASHKIFQVSFSQSLEHLNRKMV